jgi:hypothetical protein
MALAKPRLLRAKAGQEPHRLKAVRQFAGMTVIPNSIRPAPSQRLRLRERAPFTTLPGDDRQGNRSDLTDAGVDDGGLRPVVHSRSGGEAVKAIRRFDDDANEGPSSLRGHDIAGRGRSCPHGRGGD